MIEKEIALLDKLSDYYEEEIINILETKNKSIVNIFEWLIQKEAKNYNLISENSVHDSVYVNISSRIKKKNSFREKLIRRNLGSALINDLNLTEENFNSKKAEISNIIESFEDLIGLRMVCDLNLDCPRALEMIKNNLKYLKDKKIDFQFGEIESQPQKMMNGLRIFRLKGVFDDRIGFELQIKSKIDEAWGDLDHFIFYKDYTFYPSKNSVQQTMNNVGKLLDKIEDLLFDLRRSKEEYDQNLHNLIFIESLSKCYSLNIKEILGFSFQIEKLAPTLQYLIKEEYPKFFNDQSKKSLNFNFLEFNLEDEIYKKSRQLSIELKLIEAIFQQIWEKKKDTELKESNYSVFILALVNYLKNNIINIVNQNGPLLDYSLEDLNKDLIYLLKYNAKENPWLSAFKFAEFSSLKALINDFIYENFETEVEEDYINEEEIDFMNNIIFSCHFDADLKKTLNDNTGSYTQNIILSLKENLMNNNKRNSSEQTLYYYTNLITNSLVE